MQSYVSIDSQPEQFRYDPICVEFELCALGGNLSHDARRRPDLSWGNNTGGHMRRRAKLMFSLLTVASISRYCRPEGHRPAPFVMSWTAAIMNKIGATGEGFVSGWINGTEPDQKVFRYSPRPKLTMMVGAAVR
jgi:hypothetical protein